MQSTTTAHLSAIRGAYPQSATSGKVGSWWTCRESNPPALRARESRRPQHKPKLVLLCGIEPPSLGYHPSALPTELQKDGAPGRGRAGDLPLTRRLLYHLSYEGKDVGAGSTYSCRCLSTRMYCASGPTLLSTTCCSPHPSIRSRETEEPLPSRTARVHMPPSPRRLRSRCRQTSGSSMADGAGFEPATT